jgi:DNA-binding transcriptional regulator YiaG
MDMKDLPSPDELRALIDRLGLTTGATARLTRTDDRTFRRWLTSKRDPPPAAVLLLQAAEEVPGVLAWLMARDSA